LNNRQGFCQDGLDIIPALTTALNIIKHATSTVRDAKKDLERHLDMEFRVIISMPAMIVPFEMLSPKHKNITTYRGLEAIDEQLYQMLSENGIEALYDDR